MRARWGHLLGLATLTATGCAGFWDEVTSREFSLAQTLNPPEPMSVLKNSTDGDARAKAYARLTEPATRGGTQAEQDEVVGMLTSAVVSEKQPLCRMAAATALGRFQDPRAVPALIAAYEASDQLTPEPAAMLRCRTLHALGETKRPEAANFLAEVAKRPVKSDLTERERGQARDVRLAAVRSLKNFPQHAEAAAVAQALATQDRDVAVRDRARESYVAMTGKEPPAPVPTTPPVTNPVTDGIATVGHNQRGK